MGVSVVYITTWPSVALKNTLMVCTISSLRLLTKSFPKPSGIGLGLGLGVGLRVRVKYISIVISKLR